MQNLMKAALLTIPEEMRVVDIPVPPCEPGGILVRVRACAVCGSDVRTYRNPGPVQSNVPGEWLAVAGVAAGRLMGHEFAGEVVEAGRGVDTFGVGDRVAVSPSLPCGECHYCLTGRQNICENFRGLGQHLPGAYAEYVSIPEAALRAGNVIRLPEGLSFEEATVADPLASVLNGQEKLGISTGESVLVIGAGPIGCMHAMLAKLRGAVPVMLAQRSPERLALAEETGCADVYVNSSRTDLRSWVKGHTGGRGADIVIVACPSREAQEQSIDLVGRGGRISFFGGLPAADALITIDANKVHYSEISIHGAFAVRPSQYATALKMVASGRVPARKIVTNVLPLERISEAFSAEVLKNSLKVVVHPSGPIRDRR